MDLGDCSEPVLFTGLAAGMVQVERRGVTADYDSGEEAEVKACGFKFKFLIGSVTTVR